MANSAVQDQLASSESNWSGSTLFAKEGYIRVQQDKGLIQFSYYTMQTANAMVQIRHAAQMGKLICTSIVIKWLIDNLVEVQLFLQFTWDPREHSGQPAHPRSMIRLAAKESIGPLNS